MCGENSELLAKLDGTGHCDPCEHAGFYCHTYLGPRYGCDSCVRLLIVGLDHGNGRRTESAAERRRGIINYREGGTEWNFHYQGCIRVSGLIFGSDCAEHCQARCARKPESECTLLHFAQANAVRCSKATGGMAFNRGNRVSDCISLLFSEVQLLRPDVIVLQGRNRRSGHIQVDFKTEACQRGEWTDTSDEHVSRIMWRGADCSTVILSLRHPSRGWLVRDWGPIIVPAVRRALALLNPQPD